MKTTTINNRKQQQCRNEQ